ncbi:hypothetical protein BKA65DRAFT_81466 [Rhexocercosporidium sp. MPI-PUGE-AT-0058]|nr:hypothetical protein BKA65DRAFT_81466 [Rhexocercosporidium sp. MPI-PUGE-AT-0058]
MPSSPLSLNSPSSLSPLTELTSTAHLLHLTHHRNKNQHRLAKWWKSFSILRRQAGKLVEEVEALERCLRFSSASTIGALGGKEGSEKKKGDGEGKRKKVKGGNGVGEGESKYVKAARETVEERVEFLEVWVLPRCFLAFSNVVADNQYAALGLMLMATLARVRRVLRGLGREKANQDGNENEGGRDADVKEVLLAEQVADARATDLGEVVSREEVVDIAGEDEGIEVKKSKKKKRRERVEEDGEAESGAGTGVGDGVGASATPAKRPKKKRKKGDAFDDLFAGLI